MPRTLPPLLALLLLLTACAGPMSETEGVPVGAHRLTLTLDDDGRTLSYLLARDPLGVDRRLILVHGTPGSANAWRSFVKEPPPRMEVIAVDRPGFGRSTPADAVVSFQEQAAALTNLLDHVDGRKPILLGHSLGGPIVARAAADYPDRVGAIVILSGSLDPRYERVGLIQGLVSTPPVRAILPRPLRNSLIELLAGREQTEALAHVLPRIRCPVVIIHGVNDALVPYDNVDFMQRTLAAAASIEIVTIPRGDHFLPWNRRDEIFEALTRLHNAGLAAGW